jgi:hypothetical protein
LYQNIVKMSIGKYVSLIVSYRFNNYSKSYKGQSATEKDLN